MSNKVLKPRWQARFDFFESLEKMSKEERKLAYKKSPFSIKFNFFAFFFGFIYFLILGLWRKGLVLLIAGVISTILEIIILQNLYISDTVDRAISYGISFGSMAIYASCVNLAYYLHIKKGSKSWNPFEGWKDYY